MQRRGPALGPGEVVSEGRVHHQPGLARPDLQGEVKQVLDGLAGQLGLDGDVLFGLLDHGGQSRLQGSDLFGAPPVHGGGDERCGRLAGLVLGRCRVETCQLVVPQSVEGLAAGAGDGGDGRCG